MTHRLIRDRNSLQNALQGHSDAEPRRVIALRPGLDLRELAQTDDLRGVKFTGRLDVPYLSGLDLRGADFSGATLTGAQFQDARLGGTNFSGAVLDCVNLSGASLAGAVLAGATLRHCTVKYTCFEDAVLYRTALTGTRLTSPQLHAANTLGTEMVLCALLGRVGGLAAELRAHLEGGQDGSALLDDAEARWTDLDVTAVRLWLTGAGAAVGQLTAEWISAWVARRAAGWN